MKKTSKLKPCPFCGSEATVYQHGSACFGVTCTNMSCLCKTTAWTDEEGAVTAWNNRDGKTITDAQVDALFRYCEFTEKNLTDAKEIVIQNSSLANVVIRDRWQEKVFTMKEVVKTIGLFDDYLKYTSRKGSKK